MAAGTQSSDDGRLQLDVRNFDVTVATQRTDAFPYPTTE